MNNEEQHWTTCSDCQGRGRKTKRLTKKVRLRFQETLADYERNGCKGDAPVRPKGHQEACKGCKGSGLVLSDTAPLIDRENFPHVAIVGGGIGGVALAIACKHRGIPFTLFERDTSFSSRSQGYGLTLQQAHKAMEGLGLFTLEEGVVSTRHVVHNTEGKEVAEWGMRKWIHSGERTSPKRTNIHIARQALRAALLQELGGDDHIEWDHQLINFEEQNDGTVTLNFQVDGKEKQVKAGLLVGADGIRSSVRRQLVGEELSPLRYLGCIVILGICPLANLENAKHPLLDSATIFQTANGHERMYMMPYSADTVMWQLSFPIAEDEAKQLSQLGPQALKEEAIRRCPWHEPIPQILDATEASLISGYPAYDRALLEADLLQQTERVTLLGDAAHPMSPFKGQGANQAILDALSLARTIKAECRPKSAWKELGIRKAVLNEFEEEMLARSAIKVKGSAEAAEFLHSELALHESDEPRGSCREKDHS